MHAIHSGTTMERVVRTAFIMLLMCVFAIMFLYDGYVGYARQNAVELAKSLGLDPDVLPVINQELTANEAKRFAQSLPERDSIDAVVGDLGDPSIRHEDHVYYLGQGGYLRLDVDGAGQVVHAEWRDGAHTEADLLWQKWIGHTLGIVALAFIAQFVRVVTTRVSLTDAGLKVRGKVPIPFDVMTRLGTDSYEQAGRIEIEYGIDGQQGVVELNAYAVKDLDAIIAAICERTGFDSPLSGARESTTGADEPGDR